jgi:crotonobetainyl-CoA:carnitine CoA-transferase CaiB-like acyl-CoA transferase
MSEREGELDAVLDGVRVLDFGRYIAGPYCAALLADLGADVIRIERIGGGEDRWVAPVGPDGVGAMYVAMNRNKRAMTLDPGCPEGREIVRKLVATADVVVANLPPEVLRSLALDLDSLRRVKPDIILTTVTAFGAGGPWSHKHGFDGIGQVMAGGAYLTGTPEQPLRAAVAWVDFGTASVSAFGTLAALMARNKTGRGQKVEAALLRTAVAFNNPTLVEQQVAQPNRVATLNRGQTSAPSDLFRTSDGWIIAYAIGGPMFARWARLMGNEHWLTDPRFADDLARGDNGEVISKRMAEWTAVRTTAEALAELEKAKVPAGPLYSPQQALEDDHIRAAGLLADTDYPGLPRPAPLAPTPVDLSETPGQFRRRAPTLGEHTDAILGELGYDTAAIAGLRERRVI